MKKLILAIAFLLAGASAQAMTLSDIETQVRRNIRDTQTSSDLQKYSDSVLDAMINEAQREVSNLTWCVEMSTSRVLAAGTTYYNLPDDFIAARLAVFTRPGASTIELQERLQGSLVDDFPSYEQGNSGAPTEYLVRQSTSGGNNLEIAYLPTPTSTSTGTVRVDYYAYPDDLSADSDVPFEGLLHLYPYHYALVAHVSARVKEVEGKLDEAAYWRAQFDRYLQIMQQRLESAPNYNPGTRPASK
jgi:hypothetical protein